jgi:Aminopeptidase I zinc metalloprotease (M18)
MNSSSALEWTILCLREYKYCYSIGSLALTVTAVRFAAVEALSEVASSDLFPLEGNVNCIALFNHEEIGSVSTSGAESSLIPSLLERLNPSPALLAQSIAKSLLISADMGHAVHPNYASKHEDNHRPYMNGGIVIKTNAKQRYATDAIGTFLVKKLLEKKGGKVQEFEVRNDMCVIFLLSLHSLPEAFKYEDLVARLSDLCCPSSACAQSMLVAECSRCTPSERLLGHTTYSIRSTFSLPFLRDLLGSTHSLQ